MRNPEYLSKAVFRTICIIMVLVFSIAAPPAHASEEKDAAKTIFSKWRDTVITIKATIKVRMIVGGSEKSKEENEIEALATVIDPSGLSVISFSCIDPSIMFGGLLKKLKTAKSGPQMDMRTDIAGLTMILPDGRELPAKVILRDPDLDLAFVGPEEKLDKPLAALELSGERKHEVLEAVCILGRLDKAAGRGPCISIHNIEAVIESPRRCYVADNSALLGRLGAPVFSLDGELIGFSLLKISKSPDSAQMVNFESNQLSSLGITPVILPAAEVTEVARQAMEIISE